jgi:hypothetical protein
MACQINLQCKMSLHTFCCQSNVQLKVNQFGTLENTCVSSAQSRNANNLKKEVDIFINLNTVRNRFYNC